ncbi:MAG TPA: hypothetical protein VLF71_04465 [Candidatus Saccharimonadales bacterium]|nr:hypothetical protein [Candidatus Saccharimonadales bacterium]
MTSGEAASYREDRDRDDFRKFITVEDLGFPHGLVDDTQAVVLGLEAGLPELNTSQQSQQGEQ